MKRKRRDSYLLRALDAEAQLQAAYDLVAHLWGHVHEGSVPQSTRRKVAEILKGRK